MCLYFDDQRRVEPDLRFARITTWICDHSGRANDVVGMLVDVAMNPERRIAGGYQRRQV